VPDYVGASQVSIDRDCERLDRDLHLGPVEAGEQIRLAYPLNERTETERIDASAYVVSWRGGRVVTVSPPAQQGCAPYWWRAG
jgi:hypothetical protein